MEGYQFPFELNRTLTGRMLYEHIRDLMTNITDDTWIIIRSVDLEEGDLEEGEIRDDEGTANYPDTNIRFDWPEIPYDIMSQLWHLFWFLDGYFVASLIGPAEWEDCTTRYGRGWTLMIRWKDEFLWIQ